MYGISVRNDENHILVSSDIRSFHFMGEAALHSNDESGLTTFTGYGGDGLLSGRCMYTFRIAAVNEQSPLVFIRPGAHTTRYGVLRTWYEAGYWYIKILQHGPTYQHPRVYAFTQLTGVTAPMTDTGLVTFLDNGEVAFDSGRRPMAIHDVAIAVPPSMPCDTTPSNYSYGNWNQSSWLNGYGDYHCDTTFNTYDIADAAREDVAFLAPSIAESVIDNVYSGYYKSCGYGGSCQEHRAYTWWWAMYHAAYGLQGTESDLQLTAGWSTIRAGYSFSQNAEGGGWFGGSGKSYSSGARPYSEKTINLTTNPIILINASHYDA